MKTSSWVVASGLWLLAGNASAADRADLEGTKIIGNRELPKVLYIVPWKKPQVGDLVGRPVASLLDEAIAPVDRDVFRRQVQYHATLKGMDPAGNAVSAAPASATK